jgi:hypothetical protein
MKNNWFDKLIKKLGCKLYGHCECRVVEPYLKFVRAKNFSGNLSELVSIPTYHEVSVYGKIRCGHCGEVFIGIVKDGHGHKSTIKEAMRITLAS